eukprot:TRINITY_DN9098_c0_g1_i1.p1 TRINITY_DN9098_c0_g1~~TRINITY_DN9098_c0_g1_i1.p1  ORF type:complete len:285 (-),score=20.18 TRINITY_DN9098_c0_g1_i1:97-885(-)
MHSSVPVYKIQSRLEPYYNIGVATLSKNYQHLICGYNDAESEIGELKVVSTDTGRVTDTFKSDSFISCVAISPDNDTIAAASQSQTVRCWSLQSKQLIRQFQGHKGPISCMCFDDSGGLVCTGSVDRGVRVWDVAGGFCTHSFYGHKDILTGVLWHGTEMLLFSCGRDCAVRVWDLVEKKCKACFDNGHKSAVNAMTLSQDGWSLFSAGEDSVIIQWSVKTLQKASKYDKTFYKQFNRVIIFGLDFTNLLVGIGIWCIGEIS